jgi:hypothetical protein
MQAPPAPNDGDKLDLKAMNGALLHITVKDIVRDIPTVHGISDAISADVVVLDGTGKGDTYEDTLIFPKVLRSQLTQVVGTADPVVVARLGQGQAKPGKSAPWILTAPTADDLDTAKRYEARPGGTAKAAAAPAAEPAGDNW